MTETLRYAEVVDSPQPHSGRTSKRKVEPSALDISIMGTNDSSIVSKRSVERLYLPEPHFFRYFVKKPKRRSPLINRGYWLRMKAIENEIDSFLCTQDPRTKVVVNLGCGYDPLPFYILAKKANPTSDVVFVDVDYPSLIKNKMVMIQASPEIGNLLGETRQPSHEGVMLAYRHYYALGCDLSYPEQLETQLKSLFSLTTTSFCFVAEVSITYMKERDADKLIRWASGIKNAQFCLLEQCLPWGEEHPFAKTMLSHFAKLGTRLRSLKNYPTIGHQKKRFENLGWDSVRAVSLWKQWSLPDFVTREERFRINAVEPFDEWEDFALFAQHYFILIANLSPSSSRIDAFCGPKEVKVEETYMATKEKNSFWLRNSGSSRAPVRGHGVLFTLDGEVLCHHGGYGLQRRLADSDVFSQVTGTGVNSLATPPIAIGEIMCHAATNVEGDDTVLLTGGRKSPDSAFSDCWIKKGKQWGSAEPLPRGLYRHCAISLKVSRSSETGAISANKVSNVLVYGGKSGRNEVSGEWYIYTASLGQDNTEVSTWRNLRIEGADMEPRFGASMCQLWQSRSSLKAFEGLVMGGMTAEGLVAESVFRWRVDTADYSIRLSSYRESGYRSLCRFGAKGIASDRSGDRLFYLTGGIAGPQEEPEDYRPIIPLEILADSETVDCEKPFGLDLDVDRLSARCGPLLTGHNAMCTTIGKENFTEDEIVIVGGSAVCFSFGSFHNKSIWSLRGGQERESTFRLVADRTKDATTPYFKKIQAEELAVNNAPMVIQVARQSGAIQFRRWLEEGHPRVVQGLELGDCTKVWSCNNLKDKVGGDKNVIVHFSEDDVLNFRGKNFEYKKMLFGEFLDLIQSGGRHYLRALSSISTAKPANFWKDFPELASDFRLPDDLSDVINEAMPDGRKRAHSSVLRLSGPVAMWLHYDVMANVLCQIKGKKRLLLFPPGDVTLLRVLPGQSSSGLNMFDLDVYKTHPELRGAHPHEVRLEPGDVLFIPAFWLHTAQPTEGISMAVNVFFRDLDVGYASGRDAYGNRDLQAYEEGRKDVKGIVARFKDLPSTTRRFYLQRLAQELQIAAEE